LCLEHAVEYTTDQAGVIVAVLAWQVGVEHVVEYTTDQAGVIVAVLAQVGAKHAVEYASDQAAVFVAGRISGWGRGRGRGRGRRELPQGEAPSIGTMFDALV
jgi:hypothetical protein